MFQTIRTFFLTLAALSIAAWAHAETPIVRAAISPDGARLAIETRVRNQPALAIFENDDAGAAPRLFNLSGQTVTRLHWADNAFLLIHTEQLGPGEISVAERRESENVRFGDRGGRDDLREITFSSLYALNVQSMRALQLLAAARGVAFTPNLDDVAALTDDGAIYMRAPIWVADPNNQFSYVAPRSAVGAPPVQSRDSTPSRMYGRLALWRVRLADGDTQRVETPTFETRDWIVSSNGQASWRINRDEQRTTLLDGDGEHERVMEIAAETGFISLGVRHDGVTAEVLTLRENAPPQLILINLATGAIRDHEAAAQGLRAETIVRDERTGLVDGWRGADGRVVWIDPVLRDLNVELDAAFGAPVEIVSSSADNRRHVILVATPEGGAYYFFDAFVRSAEPLGPQMAPTPPAR